MGFPISNDQIKKILHRVSSDLFVYECLPVLPVYMHHEFLVPGRSECIESPGTRVKDGCELSC